MRKAIFNLIAICSVGNMCAQTCATDVETGINLIKNHDFSEGYSEWTHDTEYAEFVACGSSCSSRPGYVYVGTDPSEFNLSFPPINDHSASADNMMLMVDGLCSPGIKLWSQSNIEVKPNTNYYFSLWLASIYTGTTFQGTLVLDINGVNQPGTITPPTATAGAWVQYEVEWNSGSNTNITLSLENTTATGCNNGVDFAIDDITFTPGCQYGSTGPQPDLGMDRTLCGAGGSITLNSGVAAVNGLSVTWNDGLTGSGTSAPVSRSITAPGTYSVCVSLNGSCVKSSVINISNTFSVNLEDALLCDPITTTLDAVYTGPGVKYTWYREHPVRAGGNDSSRTYFVTAGGTYRVDVTDPLCGTRSDVAVITSNAATPIDGSYCASGSTADLGVTGTGRYKWCSNATGPCIKVGVGDNFTTPGLIPSAVYTYYVEDTTTFSTTVGPRTGATNMVTDPNIAVDAARGYVGFLNANPGSDLYYNTGKDIPPDPTQDNGVLVFNADNDFRLDSISVFVINNYCAAGVNDVITIEILDPSNMPLAGSPITFNSPCKNLGGGIANAYKVRVPIGIDIPKGTGYKMRMPAGGAGIAGFLNGSAGGVLPTPTRYRYPTAYDDAYGDPVVTFQNNIGFSLYYHPTAFPGYFDWKITKGINCQRVPVRAIYACTTPVNFISFKAEYFGENIKISYSTVNESTTNKYLIQHSVNGHDFNTIGEITELKRQGINHYDFVVSHWGEGTNYYRIVEVATTGMYIYSDVRQVFLVTEHQISLFPNPTKGVAILKFESEDSKWVNVYNSVGTIVETFSLSELQSQQLEFGSDYGVGIYFVEISTEQNRYIFKLIKE